MPMVRYRISNEYGLSDPELYGAAEKDDPEALLEGVAMAGLVGLLRQLGDLAEFAAEIFHELHEEVMVTACRGHELTLRLHQLEAEFPSVEKALISKISLPNVIQNDGVEWHTNIDADRNLITRGDMPRFVMDSYEECRGPPRLFTLDKFDVAGAGACLKRYSDPSFFKTEMASSGLIENEDTPREKKPRKIKKKATRLKKGETLESLLISMPKSESSTENQAPGRAPISRIVKLKSRKLNYSENNTRNIHHEHLLELIESQQKILLEGSEKQSRVKRERNGITKPENSENDPSNYAHFEKESGKIFPIQEQNEKIEIENKDKVLGESDDVASEQENFVDALNSIDSESEVDADKKPKLDPIDANSKDLEISSQMDEILIVANEFDEANEEFFDNDDLMDVSSTSSLHSENNLNNELIMIPKSELNDLDINEDELSAKQTQENSKDLPSEDRAEENNEEVIRENDNLETLEIPSGISNSEEIKISDEAWIFEDSSISNEEEKLINEDLNEDSSDLNKEDKCVLENLQDTVSSVNELEDSAGIIEREVTNEDSLVSGEEIKSTNEDINEIILVSDEEIKSTNEDINENILVSDEENKSLNEDINESCNVENSDSEHNANELEGNLERKVTNAVSLVSDEATKSTHEDINDSCSVENSNYNANEFEERSENSHEASLAELKNISDEILNLEEFLISNTPSKAQQDSFTLTEKNGLLLETEDHPEEARNNFGETSDEISNHEDFISFREDEIVPANETTEENADYSSEIKDEKILGETLIQPNQEPNYSSNEPLSPNLEENSLETLNSFEKSNEPKDWEQYLLEQTNNDQKNNSNFDDSLERYAENPFVTNSPNLILLSDNEEDEMGTRDFNTGVNEEFNFVTNNDFLWEPASPPREEPFLSEYINQSNNSAHHDYVLAEQDFEPVPYQLDDGEPDFEPVPYQLDDGTEVSVPNIATPDEFGDSFVPVPFVDLVHEPLVNDSVDLVHEIPLADQAHEPKSSETNIGESNSDELFCDLDPEKNLSEECNEISSDEIVPNQSLQETVENIGTIATIVPSILLDYDNDNDNKQSEEDSDPNCHDFSRNSNTTETGTVSMESMSDKESHVGTRESSTVPDSVNDLSVEDKIYEINKGPLINTDLVETKPDSSTSTLIESNAGELDMSSAFSLVSQNSNLSLQNEEKPPPLPPLGWRLGGRLRKGFSLPANGFIPVNTPDPFMELPSLVEPKQADIVSNGSQGGEEEKPPNQFEPINEPDPFKPVDETDPFEHINAPNQFEPINEPGPFKPVDETDPFEHINAPNQFEPINEPGPFKPVDETDPFEHINAPNPFVEMPNPKPEGEKPRVNLSNLPPISNPNPLLNPYLGQNPGTDLSTNMFLPVPSWGTGPVQIHQPGYLISLEENLWAQYGIGPSVEDERLGRNKPYSIRNIPRNPLMDAVANHDRSTMRKVSELARLSEKDEFKERNSLLEQIRNKSFSLRSVGATKSTAVKAPQTNLKVVAIVEKANAIRQACVGSDEEDEEDSWSDE